MAVERTRPVHIADLERARKCLEHRGPDAANSMIGQIDVDRGRSYFGLAHTRLSIVDLDPRSNQPFEKDGATIVFNGEIYNFREIREERLAEVRFRTDGDTEVLLEILRNEGIDGISRLMGQWAFAYHKEGSSGVVLGHDRFGKKPLFFLLNNDQFIVSSTVTAITAYTRQLIHFDRNFVRSFLRHPLTPLAGENTPYEEIKQLPAGHVANFDVNRWTLDHKAIFQKAELPDVGLSEMDLAQRLSKAVERRLVSDRPIGLLLSGGVDSTLILSILKAIGRLDEVSCFVGEAGNSADATFALEAARAVGIEPTLINIDYDRNAFGDFLSVCAHQERPFRLLGNLIAMPQLYRAVSETPIKVVLDGTGADEMFGGYWDRYFPFAIRNAMASGNLLWLLGSAAAARKDPRRWLSAARLAVRGHFDQLDPSLREAFGEDILEPKFDSYGSIFGVWLCPVRIKSMG